MSYDIFLYAADSAKAVTKDALARFSKDRSGWKQDDDRSVYAQPFSGTEFRVEFAESSEDHPELGACLSLSSAGGRPHTAGVALVREVGCLCEAVGLVVHDPQSGEEVTPFDARRLLAGWNYFNDFVIKTFHGQPGARVPPHMEARKLDAAVAWNQWREGHQGSDSVFVPRISYCAGEDGRAMTFVAWVSGAGLLPVVDRMVTPQASLSWTQLQGALSETQENSTPAPHYVINSQLAQKVDAVIARGQPLEKPIRALDAEDVLTAEVLLPILAKAKA